MEYGFELSLLSSSFALNYPSAAYPELMHKPGRPYTCLLIESRADYFILVPFRSSINHKNAFLFTNTIRSKNAKSGLDYSKIIIIKDTSYLDSSVQAIVDQDEYAEMMKHISTIVQEVDNYINTYVNHVLGNPSLHPKVYARKYQYSTLPYFHDLLFPHKSIISDL